MASGGGGDEGGSVLQPGTSHRVCSIETETQRQAQASNGHSPRPKPQIPKVETLCESSSKVEGRSRATLERLEEERVECECASTHKQKHRAELVIRESQEGGRRLGGCARSRAAAAGSLWYDCLLP